MLFRSNQGIVDKSGAWYNYQKDRIGQGKDNAREYLEENEVIANEIEGRIREKLGVRVIGQSAGVEAA